MAKTLTQFTYVQDPYSPLYVYQPGSYLVF